MEITSITGDTASIESSRGNYTIKVGDICIVSPANPRACPKHRGRRCLIVAMPSEFGWDTNCKIRYLDTNRIGSQPPAWLIPEGWQPEQGVQDA